MDFKVLLVVLVLYRFRMGSAQTEPVKNGFCMITWTTRNATYEPYTYTKREHIQTYCGWRPCMKEQIVSKTDMRLVFRDLKHTRADCCEGFQKTDIHGDVFDCEPICDPICSNGFCSSPGNCTCFHGYEHATSSSCVPSCNPDCMNGVCTSPGTCECYEGYHKVNSSFCAPTCSSSCINGVCSGPNECLCNSGFEKNATNPFVCNPTCVDGCINATCVNVNECECIDNHVKENPFKPNICTPFCSLECLNGKCTAPNTCSCKEGYHIGDEHWNICLPKCNCTNGFCLEPNDCICYGNYTLIEGDCEPICDTCINSTCVSPYFCECLEGFKRLTDTVCVPECSNCRNGICTEPEVCSCFPGYQSDEGSCEPICDSGCANGICVSPNNCSCESELEKIEENLCFPVCGTNCSNCSEVDCPVAERTKIDFIQSSAGIVPFLRLHLKVNCSELYQNDIYDCDFLSNDRINCTGLPIECSVVQNTKETFKFLCIWTGTTQFNNNTYETYYTAFTESTQSIFYGTQLNESRKVGNEISTTVLLPKTLMVEEESCELCSVSSNKRWDETNEVTFHLLPCPKALKESLYKEEDNLLMMAAIGVGLVALALIIALAYSVYRGKFHEYIVSSKYERTENHEDVMLTQETQH